MDTEITNFISSALGVEAPTAAYLASQSNLQKHAGNSVVYYQDDPTTHIYLLKSGYIRLSYISEDGFVTLLSIVPPSRSFGESGILENLDHCDTASTVGATEILAINLQYLRDHSPLSIDVRQAIARIVAQRYRAHVAFTRALYLPNLKMRLSNALLSLLPELGNSIRFRSGMHDCLGPVVSQRDLGSMARGTRENVNKTLRGWENEGIIALEDRHIVILDRIALEKLANGL